MVALKHGEDGVLYVWDADRGKYLSVNRTSLLINSTQPGHNWALQIAGGSEGGGRNPYIMPRDGTFTNITFMSEQVNSQEMGIFFYNQNGVSARHDSIRLPETGADASEVLISGSLNFDFDAGDWVRAASERIEDTGAAGSIVFPVVLIEIAWRTN